VVFEETGDEEEDEYFKPFLPKPLNATAAGGIHNGTLLLVVDFSQVCVKSYVWEEYIPSVGRVSA
jgi:hypothetical protein